jgi:oxygen-dependent protoporphyrinogen oxidase
VVNKIEVSKIEVERIPTQPIENKKFEARQIANPDVIIIGGGIAGLAAALRCQDHGLTPLVLEAEARVGGRMTTDRVNGFLIDRGVTLLGKKFTRMRSLARRLGLGNRMHDGGFKLGLEDGGKVRSFRDRRPDDLFRDSGLSWDAKRATFRFFLDLCRNRSRLAHGESGRALHLDRENVAQYLAHSGSGGTELLNRFFEPSMCGPVGGSVANLSAEVFFQTIRNTLAAGFWGVDDGVDLIPKAIAAQVPVQTNAHVLQVRHKGPGPQVTVEAIVDGRPQRYTARGCIFAVPGHLVPGLCPDLPEWIVLPLSHTRYASMASAHVALRKPPQAAYSGYGFAGERMDGVQALEFEHLRSPFLCPQGRGLISIYYKQTPTFPVIASSDDALRTSAIQLMRRTFPDIAHDILFVHLVRWPAGIALFPAGRLTEMAALRTKLAAWDSPLDFCGDYLDGLSSEGALCTGEQAADRMFGRLNEYRPLERMVARLAGCA